MHGLKYALWPTLAPLHLGDAVRVQLNACRTMLSLICGYAIVPLASCLDLLTWMKCRTSVGKGPLEKKNYPLNSLLTRPPGVP